MMFNYQRVTAEELQSQLRRAPQIGPMPKKAKNKKAAAEPEVEIDPDLKDCGTKLNHGELQCIPNGTSSAQFILKIETI